MIRSHAGRALGAAVLLVVLGLGACAAQRKGDAGAPSAPAGTAAGPAAPGPRPDPSLVAGTGTVVFFAPRGEVAIRSEIVNTPAGRAQGLMYRRELAPDRGMVFVFPSEEVQSFWMRNTYVALDIVFVNAAMEVVGVAENAQPLTETPRTVGRPSKYVVEVVAGLARANRIGAGTKVRFEDVPLVARE